MTYTDPTTTIALYGIGYQGRTLSEVVELLLAQKVEVVADVRQTPVSRKPGFSRRALSQALIEVGIDYELYADLGNPRDNRDGFRAGDTGALRRYRVHIETHGRHAFRVLADLSRRRTVALLCFERDQVRCHRSYLVDRIKRESPEMVVSWL